MSGLDDLLKGAGGGESGGLGDLFGAQSWVGTSGNEPADAADVREAFGDDELDRIAQQLGISQDEAAQAVAQVLPEVVDKVSPEGELPSGDELNQRFGRLHELGRAS